VCPGYIRTDISKNAIAADGSSHGKMDENQLKGLSAEKCAEKIVDAIKTNKEEISIGGKETLGIYIKRFFPKMLSKIVRNQTPK
ncbi:MAG: short-chain dehydrogenase, partial [Spirosomataceae bacterium]